MQHQDQSQNTGKMGEVGVTDPNGLPQTLPQENTPEQPPKNKQSFKGFGVSSFNVKDEIEKLKEPKEDYGFSIDNSKNDEQLNEEPDTSDKEESKSSDGNNHANAKRNAKLCSSITDITFSTVLSALDGSDLSTKQAKPDQLKMIEKSFEDYFQTLPEDKELPPWLALALAIGTAYSIPTINAIKERKKRKKREAFKKKQEAQQKKQQREYQSSGITLVPSTPVSNEVVDAVEIKSCAYCGNELKGRQKKYCSNSCKNNHQKELAGKV